MLRIIAVSMILLGLIFGCYRYFMRFNANPISLIRVKPYCIFETIRGWGFYGYECEYIKDGKIIQSKAIEFGMYAWRCPEKVFPVYDGVITKDGKISCNGIYSIEKLSILLIIVGICAYLDT